MSSRADAAGLPVVTALALLAGAFVASVLITALLSPAVLLLLHELGAGGAAFDEVVIRTLELVAIALTVIVLAWLQAGGRRAWGIPESRTVVRRVSLGFAFGVVSLAVVCALLYAFGVRVVRHNLSADPALWLEFAVGVMLSAAVVAVLEELWFRGGLFTLLRRCGGLGLALVGGSAFYAAAHFLTVPGGLTNGDRELWSAFEVMGAAFKNVFQLQNLDSFVALFVAGLTLALLRLRHGDVAMCIGVHAGWVLTIKVFKKLTYVSTEGTNRFLAGHYDDVIGWLAAACLAVMLVMVWKFARAEPAT